MGSGDSGGDSSRPPEDFADFVNLANVVTTFAGERYEVLVPLGRGAAGDVYLARTAASSVGFSRAVCIKRMSGQLSAEGERSMREEARVLAAFRHANVVSLLGTGQEPSGAPFLVLEFIDGADLRVLEKAILRRSDPDRVRASGILPTRVALHIACKLFQALGAIQRAMPGLVHRDVTPHNVLISREGEVKLTDFGIALAVDRARWTMPSVVKGKWGYMAPEQIRGDRLDARTDLFAVGVILFELLTGRRPWSVPRGTLDELRAIEAGDFASILDLRPGLDRVLGRGVDRLLAYEKRDRYPSFDAALRALWSFAEGEIGSLRLAAILETELPDRPAPPPALSRPAMTESAPKLEADPDEDDDRAGEASRGDPASHGPSPSDERSPKIEPSEDEDLTAIASPSARKKR